MSLRRCCITPYGGPHLDSCPAMPTPPPRPEPDWRSLCARMAEALGGVADFDPDDSGGEGWLREDGWCWCGGSVEHDEGCTRARTALTAYDAANSSKKLESSTAPK